MATLRQRLARERQLHTEAHRMEAHEAKMELLRFAARYQHLRELAPFWPEIERAVLVLAAAAAALTLADLPDAPAGQVLDLTRGGRR